MWKEPALGAPDGDVDRWCRRYVVSAAHSVPAVTDAPMRGSARDKGPAASATAARAVAEGRRPRGATEEGAGAISAAPVTPPADAERARAATDAGSEPAAEDDADVLTTTLPTSPPALRPWSPTAVTWRRSNRSLAGGSGRSGGVGDGIGSANGAEPSKTEAWEGTCRPKRGTPSGDAGNGIGGATVTEPSKMEVWEGMCRPERGTPARRGAPPTGGSPEPPPMRRGKGPGGPPRLPPLV